MKVQIKSQDGINTFVSELQIMDQDIVTGQFMVTAHLNQADVKGFVNPETISVTFPLSLELSQSLTAAVTEEYNKPLEELVK